MSQSPAIKVSILTMKLSDDREEFYTRITCDGRTFDIRRYTGEFRNRAEYELAELKHLFFGDPKPDILDPKYDDPPNTVTISRDNSEYG